jgi:uncharacterized membrane protein
MYKHLRGERLEEAKTKIWARAASKSMRDEEEYWRAGKEYRNKKISTED